MQPLIDHDAQFDRYMVTKQATANTRTHYKYTFRHFDRFLQESRRLETLNSLNTEAIQSSLYGCPTLQLVLGEAAKSGQCKASMVACATFVISASIWKPKKSSKVFGSPSGNHGRKGPGQ